MCRGGDEMGGGWVFHVKSFEQSHVRKVIDHIGFGRSRKGSSRFWIILATKRDLLPINPVDYFIIRDVI